MSAARKLAFVAVPTDRDEDIPRSERVTTRPPRPGFLLPAVEDDAELAERQARETMPAPADHARTARGKSSGVFEVDATRATRARRDPRRE